MNDALLQQLQDVGALRAIDAELGWLIGRMQATSTPKNCDAADHIALLAAGASQAIAQGHSCLPLHRLDEVLRAASSDAALPVLPDVAHLVASAATSVLVGATTGKTATPLICDGERIWLRRYHDYEVRVASALAARSRARPPIDSADVIHKRLARWFALDGEIDWQAVAVALGLRSRLTIVSGGPGTGKTTTVLWLLAALLESARERGTPLPRIRLAAPTGKAAARLGESIRERKQLLDCDETVRDAIREDSASTLHRLLGYRPNGGFRHDRGDPIAADVVVVDEASMIDLPLMARLLDALHEDTTLILLGDVGQLASVEAGHVLAALGTSGEAANRYDASTAAWLGEVTGCAVPVAEFVAEPAQSPLAEAFVELRTSHRFGSDSGIGRLAAAIRAGDTEAALGILGSENSDVAWQPLDRHALARVLDDEWLVHAHAIGATADASAGLDVANHFHILTALRHGPFGSVAINRAIEAQLGDGSAWYHGRLIMIVANDYRHALFNGDIGLAWRSPEGRIDVVFPGEAGALRVFAPYTLPAHEPAFAMTVHKSQGSEFERVAVVLPDLPNRVLGRELLYTAVTRARQHVTVHGSEAIIHAAVAHRIERWSGLADKLRDARSVHGTNAQ